MRDEGKLPSGTEIERAPELFIGAADVLTDPKPGWTPATLLAKAEAGADFVQTQFCMDIGMVRRYAARLREEGLKLPVLIGIAPIPSARSARWMREKLFGTVVPDSIIERLERRRMPSSRAAGSAWNCFASWRKPGGGRRARHGADELRRNPGRDRRVRRAEA